METNPIVVYEDSDLLVVDNFLPHPEKIKELGYSVSYIDWEAPDGHTYKRVYPIEIPEVVEGLSKVMGKPIELFGMAFRLNYDKEVPNKEIHADLGWGTHAAVYYLSDPPEGVDSGTAFWKHQSGYDRIRKGDYHVFEAVDGDWDKPDKWEQTKFVSCKDNSCIIYKSELFHSRWPFSAFGNSPQDGRLVVVVFFS